MLGEKHDLVLEFPEYRERIYDLKENDSHFSTMFDEYHTLDHKVRGIEESGITTSDEYFEDLKKKRLMLKDQLYGMLKT